MYWSNFKNVYGAHQVLTSLWHSNGLSSCVSERGIVLPEPQKRFGGLSAGF